MVLSQFFIKDCLFFLRCFTPTCFKYQSCDLYFETNVISNLNIFKSFHFHILVKLLHSPKFNQIRLIWKTLTNMVLFRSVLFKMGWYQVTWLLLKIYHQVLQLSPFNSNFLKVYLKYRHANWWQNYYSSQQTQVISYLNLA